MASTNVLASEQSLKSVTLLTALETSALPSVDGTGPSPRKGVRFWLIFLAICVSLFLSALEYVSDVSSETGACH